MDLDQLERKLGIDGMSADEQMEVVSALQKSAQDKLDFVRKETIGKSAEVVIQGFKKIKSDLETRFQELDASIQAKASTLKDGIDGKDGKDGKDGRIGKDGAKGEKGDKGDKGDNGLDGRDGVSVTDAKIDFDGSLVITLSTGKEISVGEVVSPEIAEKIKVISTMSTNVAATAGTFTTLIGGGGSANYGQLTGGATTKAVQFQTLGSDTNVSLAVQAKGTGAIDLAAGSSGVNISNGGTVTAITRTVAGSGYTSIPSIAITAPTTAGGVQATATANMLLVNATIQSGGTGYTAGDALTVVGGTGSAAIITVSTVSAGVITAVTINSGGFGNYSVLPTNPVSVTGGTGSGATFNLTSWGLSGNFTITNAGSGYVEQPTVSFSGGGGSGASAYATVGSTTIVKSIGGSLQVTTAFGTAFQFGSFGSNNTSGTNYFQTYASGSGNPAALQAQGVDAAIDALISSKSTGSIRFFTNTYGLGTGAEQLRVSHTASAVNYVQVTGAATTVAPQITSQGSDTNISMVLSSKGTSDIQLRTNNSGQVQFQVLHTASAVNRPTATGSIAGAAPVIGVSGSDTNIDLALTPKGTGLVAFGTYTAGAPTATGYISIKSAAGVTYKVLVST